MQIEFSLQKDRLNRRKHCISLQRAWDMDLSTALVLPDHSQDYGEDRELAIGFIAGNLYVLVFTMKDGDILRAISLRKANASERETYAQH